jgi:hypothetical protein
VNDHEAVTFTDYRDGLLERAWELRDGDPAEYRRAIEAVVYARGRWALLVLADHELVAERIASERLDQLEEFEERLVVWSETGRWA